jgi:hypothetical protein
MAAPQFLYGDPQPIVVPIATAKATADGNIVGLSSGTLVNASDTTWNTNIATTQTDFRLLFLGISMQDKAAAVARVYGNSEDNRIGVSTGGVWEFDCASATFAVGDFVGPAKQTGDLLEDQKVVAVASQALAIGQVERAVTSGTRVRVRILSHLLPLAAKS